MKHKLLMLLLPFLLTSCSLQDFFPKGSETTKQETSPVSSPVTEEEKSESFVTVDTSSEEENKPEIITVFSINDLHGSIKEYPYQKELGLAKLEYAIKHDIDYDPETSIIISCGDSWQGGYLSHEEKTITDSLLSKMGVECMVLGNHEFDWGLETIRNLREQSPFPYLACNIKDPYGGSVHDLSDSSTIIEKKGAKIGIIGAMGPNEESSISTSALENYTFSEDLNLIQAEVTKLNNAGCDLVILGAHDSVKNSDYLDQVGNRFSTSDIQGIFGAHDHKFIVDTAGSHSIPFAEGGSNSKGYCKMTFSLKTKKALEVKMVKDAYSKYHSIDDSLLNQEIVNTIAAKSVEYSSDTKLCEFVGDFNTYAEMNRFVPMMMLTAMENYGWKKTNKIMALHNLAGIRSSLPSGDITRELLFKVSPFDNALKVIQNVPGSQLSNVLGTIEDNHKSGYYAYMVEDDLSFNASLTYDVITIDYVSEGSYWKRNLGSLPQKNLGPNNERKNIFPTMVETLERMNTPTFYATDF